MADKKTTTIPCWMRRTKPLRYNSVICSNCSQMYDKDTYTSCPYCSG